jgi:hypothetical protein
MSYYSYMWTSLDRAHVTSLNRAVRAHYLGSADAYVCVPGHVPDLRECFLAEMQAAAAAVAADRRCLKGRYTNPTHLRTRFFAGGWGIAHL